MDTIELLSKSDLNSKLGKNSFLSGFTDNSLTSKLLYISGIKALDDILEEKNIKAKDLTISLEIRPMGLSVSFIPGLTTYYAGFFNEDIKSWVIQHNNAESKTKDKSMVLRAIFGGILLGPVGAILGGLSGMDLENKGISLDEVDNLVVCTVKTAEGESPVIFSARNKHIEEVTAFLKKYYEPVLEEISAEQTADTE